MIQLTGWRGLLLLTVSLTTVHGFKQPVCGKGSRMTSYNDSRYLCCGGLLENRFQNGAEMACCNTSAGFSLYRKDTELCCGEQVGVPKVYYYRGEKHERTCCTGSGQIAEPHKLEFCCGGTSGDMYKVTFSKKTDECCNSQVYDPSDQVCCEHSETEQYQLYERGDIDYKPRCCGKVMYDVDKHECRDKINGTLRTYEAGTSMCGDSRFNSDTHICCYERTVMPKPPVIGLPRFAIPPNYQCREGVIYDDNRYDFIPSSRRHNFRAHLIPKGHQQCGNGSYNKHAERHQEFCCLGTFRNASSNASVDCCGTELYNKTTEICCGDKIKRKLGPEACCNGALYNKTDDSCCGGRLMGKSMVCCSVTWTRQEPIQKEAANHTHCCVTSDGKMQSFNRWDKRCSQGQLKPKKETRQHNTEPCYYCGSRKKKHLSKTCNLDKEYKVVVNNVTLTDMGTVLNIDILQPRRLRGHSLDVLVTFHCHCFKLGKKYMIFTKRRLGNRDFVRLGRRHSFIMRNGRKNNKLRQATCAARDLARKLPRGNT